MDVNHKTILIYIYIDLVINHISQYPSINHQISVNMVNFQWVNHHIVTINSFLMLSKLINLATEKKTLGIVPVGRSPLSSILRFRGVSPCSCGWFDRLGAAQIGKSGNRFISWFRRENPDLAKIWLIWFDGDFTSEMSWWKVGWNVVSNACVVRFVDNFGAFSQW